MFKIRQPDLSSMQTSLLCPDFKQALPRGLAVSVLSYARHNEFIVLDIMYVSTMNNLISALNMPKPFIDVIADVYYQFNLGIKRIKELRGL